MEKYTMKNGEELHYFLAMNGVSEDAATCRKLLASMPADDKIDDSTKVAEIHKRWEGGNVRMCLVRCGWEYDWVVKEGVRCKENVPTNVLVATPEDGIYNYLDEGMRLLVGERYSRFDIVALPDFDDECRAMLAKHFGEYDFRGELREETCVLSKLDIKKAVAKYGRKHRQEIESKRKQQEFQKTFKEGRLEVGNLRMDGDTFYVGDQRFGVVGVPVSAVYDNCYNLQQAAGGKEVGESIATFLTSYMNNVGRYLAGGLDRWDSRGLDKVIKYPAQMWVGSFPITIDRRQGEKFAKSFVEGIQVKKDLIPTILQTALRFDRVERLVEYVGELRRTPPEAMRLLTDGCVVKLERGGDLLFSVVREGKRWYLVAGDLRIYVEGGYRNILSLDERTGGFGHWELFQRMSKFVGERDKILEIVRKAKEAYLLVDKKARELYEEVRKRHPNRVREAAWNGRNGVVVLGEGGKQYFVEASGNCGVYEYPQGRYVCVVEKGDAGRRLPTHDRIVSKILMLLNDRELAEQVHTLRGE